MPPKKNNVCINDPKLTKIVKAPRKRVRVEKPKLKIPSIVKVKIPPIKASTTKSPSKVIVKEEVEPIQWANEELMNISPKLTSPKMTNKEKKKIELAKKLVEEGLVKSPKPASPKLATKLKSMVNKRRSVKLSNEEFLEPSPVLATLKAPKVRNRKKTIEPIKSPSADIEIVAPPKLTSPKITSPKITSPKITSPKITSPKITSPKITSPKITSPKITSPKITSPKITSPKITSLKITLAKIKSPKLTTPKNTVPKMKNNEKRKRILKKHLIEGPEKITPAITQRRNKKVDLLEMSNEGPEKATPTYTHRLRKIELSNEVARAQLVKEEPPRVVPESVQQPPMKKGRTRSRIVNKTIENSPSTASECQVVTQKAQVKKRKADSTVQKEQSVTKKRKISIRKKQTEKIVNKCELTLPRTRKRKNALLDEISQTSDISRSVLDTFPEFELSEHDDINLRSPNSKSKPGTITSRKTSSSNVSDCLSWTKDISSSSATTCVTVCSDDFIRIDGKLPTLKLTDVGLEKTDLANNVEHSLTGSESSDDESSSSTTSETVSNVNSVSQSLNLSTSSLSSNKGSTRESNDLPINIKDLYLKIANALQNIDLKWLSSNENIEPDIEVKIQRREKFFRIINEENYGQKILVDKENLTSKTIEKPCNIMTNSDYKNDRCSSPNEPYMVKTSIAKHVINEDVSNTDKGPSEDSCHESEKYVPLDTTDDDDALSLFAESISGVDSSRMCCSAVPNARMSDFDDNLPQPAIIDPPPVSNSISVSDKRSSNIEEYVPQPVSNMKKSQEITYLPSKIVESTYGDMNCNPLPVPSKIVESTYGDMNCNPLPVPSKIVESTYGDMNCNPLPVSEMHSDNSLKNTREPNLTDYQGDDNLYCYNFEGMQMPSMNKIITIPEKINKTLLHTTYTKSPVLLKDLNYKPAVVKSVIFKGICFYNLISNCKKTYCNFPHMQPNLNDVRIRLVNASVNQFIEDYMLVRNWPQLRRQFSYCFVLESVKRGLTRVLVEMAIDSVIKENINTNEDTKLKVEIIETVLLYLNDVNLNNCSDLLCYDFGQNILMCDVFMQTLSNTQNFTRFIKVFVNLIDFMIAMHRTFDLKVATHILERVCILKSHRLLYGALMKIIQHTNIVILKNPMITQFEHQLSMFDDLYAEFMVFKQQFDKQPATEAIQSLNTSEPIRSSPPLIRQNVEVQMEPIQYDVRNFDREQKYTSPDTTNMTRTVQEPRITRTFNTNSNHLQVNVNNYRVSSPASMDNQEIRSGFKGRYVNQQRGRPNRPWDRKPMFNKTVRFRTPMRSQVPYHQPPYGGPPRYMRMSKPKY